MWDDDTLLWLDVSVQHLNKVADVILERALALRAQSSRHLLKDKEMNMHAYLLSHEIDELGHAIRISHVSM